MSEKSRIGGICVNDCVLLKTALQNLPQWINRWLIFVNDISCQVDHKFTVFNQSDVIKLLLTEVSTSIVACCNFLKEHSFLL